MFEDRKDDYDNMRNSEFRNSRETLYKRKVEIDRISSLSEQIDRIESK